MNPIMQYGLWVFILVLGFGFGLRTLTKAYVAEMSFKQVAITSAAYLLKVNLPVIDSIAMNFLT